jgi:membrane associated rhomboid family serine protease
MIPVRNAVATRYPPVVTWTLIAVNCAVFLFQIGLSPLEQEWFVLRFALVPARYFAPSVFGDELTVGDFLPFITMMFLHGGWLHLIFNMWTLWLFGGTVEDRLGSGRFLAFYLACGLLAALAHILFSPMSVVPTLGASGAIAGVLGGYVRMFPMARIVLLIPIVFVPFFFEVPAILYIGFWFMVQVMQGMTDLMSPSTGGGVAWWAHIGGFLAGLILGPLLQQGQRSYRTYYADEGQMGFDPWGRR